ncbi:MAG: DUF1302 domain-containing protein [Aestuariibacter sp.]
MNKGPRIFKKSPLAVGLMTAFAASMPAQSASWSYGDLNITFDSTFSIGTSIRAEDRDFDKIAKSSQPNLDWSGYNILSNVVYEGEDIWRINADTGAYSANGDLGNLNFDNGEAFSTVFKGVHELDLNWGDYGFFMRGMYYYDFEMMDGERPWKNQISSQINAFDRPNDPCRDARAEENLCKDVRLLDAFFYADFWLGDVPVTFRLGDQVISWGESTFIQHGINNINPVDVTRARAPGAELKEVFIPVGTVFANASLTDTLGISVYYQYEWEKSILPVAGSYFATNDFAGDGGYLNNIQLSFTRNPDLDLDYLLWSLNNVGDATRAGADPAQMAAAVLGHSTKVALREKGDRFYKDAEDNGQYGIKLSYFSEELNNTEFGFYHLNYHSKRPLLVGLSADYTNASLAHDVAYLASNQVTADNVTDLTSFAKAEAIFPEDIKLYGISFNTSVGETAIAGEITYRKDEPLQMDDVTLLYAAFPEQLAAAGLRPDLAGISQYDQYIGRAPVPGERIDGVIELDTLQIQGSASHIFGPVLGTDNLIGLVEVGYVQINDMPDPSVLALEAPGTHRSVPLVPLTNPDGSVTSRTGLHVGLSNGPEVDSQFATDDAWGYRLLGVADFNNVYSGVNLRVRATFAHDVEGTTPNPMFLFVEDRKSSSVSFTFDYLSKMSASFSYNAFWGGGAANGLSDRDFISFDFKYSI